MSHLKECHGTFAEFVLKTFLCNQANLSATGEGKYVMDVDVIISWSGSLGVRAGMTEIKTFFVLNLTCRETQSAFSLRTGQAQDQEEASLSQATLRKKKNTDQSQKGDFQLTLMGPPRT